MQKQPYHSWTKDESKFIIDNYLYMSPAELSNILGVSVRQVRTKIKSLGLTRDLKKKFYVWSNNEQNDIP